MCRGVSLSAQGISSGSENLRDREEGSIKIMNCHSKMLWVHSRCIGLLVSLISLRRLIGSAAHACIGTKVPEWQRCPISYTCMLESHANLRSQGLRLRRSA
jgi:hypothetical protein